MPLSGSRPYSARHCDLLMKTVPAAKSLPSRVEGEGGYNQMHTMLINFSDFFQNQTDKVSTNLHCLSNHQKLSGCLRGITKSLSLEEQFEDDSRLQPYKSVNRKGSMHSIA